MIGIDGGESVQHGSGPLLVRVFLAHQVLLVVDASLLQLVLNLNLFEMMLVLLLDTVLVNTFELPKVTVSTPRASLSSWLPQSMIVLLPPMHAAQE